MEKVHRYTQDSKRVPMIPFPAVHLEYWLQGNEYSKSTKQL